MRQTRQCTQRPFFGAIAAKYTPRLVFSGFASQFLKRAICIFARRKEYAPHPQPKKVQQKAAPSGGGKLPLLPLCRNVIKNNFILRKEETDCIAIPPLWCIMLITIISFSGGIKWITSAKESLQINEPKDHRHSISLRVSQQDSTWLEWQRRTGELPPDFSQMKSELYLPDPLMWKGKRICTKEEWKQKESRPKALSDR